MAVPASSTTLPPPRPRPGRLLRPDGVALHYDLWGRPEQPTVLFAHGFGQTRQAWGGSAQALAERGHACWAVDGRGHGDSDWNRPDQPYSMEQFVDDLIALADASAARPALVGASMGGLLGLMAQAMRPRFSAMVLVDITPRWEAEGVERILEFMGAHPDGFSDFEHAAAEIAAYLPHRRRRKSQAQLENLLVRGADGRLRWHWDPRMLEEVARGGHHYQAQLVEAARTIDVPTLLVSGGRSDLVSDRTVQEFLDLVPHARHHRIDDATHMVAGDRNDLFTDTILDFLTEVAGPATVQPGARP
jgi:pimeloyl-ACP methyl ester carboxylesterase